MEQTSITNQNRLGFYTNVYPQQLDKKENLIDISSYVNPLLIDCCGWYYEHVFNQPVIKIESATTAKDFKLNLTQFNKLFDNRDSNNLTWPMVGANHSAVVFDRSAVMKYQSITGINKILELTSKLYTPEKIIFRSILLFVDDNRFNNRVENLCNIKIPGYVVDQFVYDTISNVFHCVYRKFT